VELAGGRVRCRFGQSRGRFLTLARPAKRKSACGFAVSIRAESYYPNSSITMTPTRLTKIARTQGAGAGIGWRQEPA